MSEKAKELLKAVFKAYNDGVEYCINTPLSNEIHTFNMAVKEIEEYIVFTRRDMLKVSMSLSDKGLEYVLENMEDEYEC